MMELPVLFSKVFGFFVGFFFFFSDNSVEQHLKRKQTWEEDLAL